MEDAAGREVLAIQGLWVDARSTERGWLVHPRPEAVSAEPFSCGQPFFLADDKVQVKYEMLRAVHVDGHTVSAASAAHGYSRAEYYLVDRAVAERGMAGLVDGRRGRGPTKFVGRDRRVPPAGGAADRSGAALARDVAERFGVGLHRRTVERARRR